MFDYLKKKHQIIQINKQNQTKSLTIELIHMASKFMKND